MRILSIDTATSVAGTAIASENELIAVSCLNVGKTHSQRFLPLLEAMLAGAELSLADMDAIAVTVGPGSFTGLRIGIATAKAFCQALQKPAVPIITLDALAYQGRGLADWICPVLDARKNELYCALYDKWGRQVLPPNAMTPEALGSLLTEKEGDILFLGDGAMPSRERLQPFLGGRYHLAPPERRLFLADAAALLACEKLAADEVVDAATLAPFYLRVSEAEKKRQESLKNV